MSYPTLPWSFELLMAFVLIGIGGVVIGSLISMLLIGATARENVFKNYAADVWLAMTILATGIALKNISVRDGLGDPWFLISVLLTVLSYVGLFLRILWTKFPKSMQQSTYRFSLLDGICASISISTAPLYLATVVNRSSSLTLFLAAVIFSLFFLNMNNRLYNINVKAGTYRSLAIGLSPYLYSSVAIIWLYFLDEIGIREDVFCLNLFIALASAGCIYLAKHINQTQATMLSSEMKSQ